MKIFDLAISFVWEYDKEFVQLIEQRFQEAGLTTFLIEKHNVSEVIEKLENADLFFPSLLDRASDEDPEFLPIIKLLSSKKSFIINPHNKVIKSIDKASMHRRLLQTNFYLPRTILVPSYNEKEEYLISTKELDKIGIPFVIKPSLASGGGHGVINNAENLQQIAEVRIKNRGEKYLIQEKIYPKTILGKRAWFRVINAFETSIPTWWDDLTHLYYRVTNQEMKKYGLDPLNNISKRLAQITQLDYFSTEIALTKDNKFYLIDYINDQCDMRLKTNHPDGVPDDVVTEFIDNMKKKILKIKSSYHPR